MGNGLLFFPAARSGLTEQAHGERYEEEDDEDREEDLGDTGGGASDAAKAQNTGNQGDDEEDECIIQHLGFSPVMISTERVMLAFVPF